MRVDVMVVHVAVVDGDWRREARAEGIQRTLAAPAESMRTAGAVVGLVGQHKATRAAFGA